MNKLLAHLEAVLERKNIFEIFYTTLWALPVMLILKVLNLFGVKTK